VRAIDLYMAQILPEVLRQRRDSLDLADLISPLDKREESTVKSACDVAAAIAQAAADSICDWAHDFDDFGIEDEIERDDVWCRRCGLSPKWIDYHRVERAKRQLAGDK
jgi:hypothetical protein